jgi:DNA-binding NarL/FixJ family response regulator
MARSSLKPFDMNDMKTFQTPSSNGMQTGAFREVHKDNNLFNPAIDRAVSDQPWPRAGSATRQEQIGQLTTREREVLQLVAEGKANKETASELCISIKTVEKHRGSLTEKLGIYGTARLTRYAIAAGIIQ